MKNICVGNLTIIASHNGLPPGRRQAIIWTNARLLSIGTLRTYYSEILIKIQQLWLTKIHLKMSSAKRRLYYLGPNVLRCRYLASLPSKAMSSSSLHSVDICKMVRLIHFHVGCAVRIQHLWKLLAKENQTIEQTWLMIVRHFSSVWLNRWIVSILPVMWDNVNLALSEKDLHCPPSKYNGTT